MSRVHDAMVAALEATTLMDVIQESSDHSGPVPDAVSKVRLALHTLVAVLATQTPERSPDVRL
jgi:hypothetical protein